MSHAFVEEHHLDREFLHEFLDVVLAPDALADLLEEPLMILI